MVRARARRPTWPRAKLRRAELDRWGDWHKHHSKSTGRSYWFNPTTKTSLFQDDFERQHPEYVSARQRAGDSAAANDASAPKRARTGDGNQVRGPAVAGSRPLARMTPCLQPAAAASLYVPAPPPTAGSATDGAIAGRAVPSRG